MQELQVAAAQPVRNHLAAASVLPSKQASFFASLTWASLVIILGAWIELRTKPASPLYTYLLWLGGLGSRGWAVGGPVGCWPARLAGCWQSMQTTPTLHPSTAGILPCIAIAWALLYCRYRSACVQQRCLPHPRKQLC